MTEHPLRLRVEVAGPPVPALLRPAIEARLSGRAFPAGPENTVALAVARAVASARGDAPEARPWR